jgi:hypothetical protein
VNLRSGGYAVLRQFGNTAVLINLLTIIMALSDFLPEVKA